MSKRKQMVTGRIVKIAEVPWLAEAIRKRRLAAKRREVREGSWLRFIAELHALEDPRK
jgi:hypothetical protein